jgi:signal transduction histidine kinase
MMRVRDGRHRFDRIRLRVVRMPVLVQDALLAAILCVLDLRTQWSTTGTRWIGDGPLPWQLVAAFAALGYAALVWRRRYPHLVFVLLLAHCIAGQLLLPYRPFLGLLVAFYTIASRTTLARSVYALGGVAVAFAFTIADEVGRVPPAEQADILTLDIIFFAILALVVLAVGRGVRQYRQGLDDLDKRRRTAAHSAVAAERGRIAHELHDIVAHSVTVIVLQAAGARRVLSGQSDQVERALVDIETTGRQAMGELRRLLKVLNSQDMPLTDKDNEFGPQPGLDTIGEVIERVSAAGLLVELREHGTRQLLDTSVDQTAIRIVTEALTNALKHAGAGAKTEVLLDWQADKVAVTVTDDGGGRRRAETMTLSTGHGLVGLGERVRALEGTLTVGPRFPSGFQIVATLPTARRIASATWENT